MMDGQFVRFNFSDGCPVCLANIAFKYISCSGKPGYF